MMNQAANQNQTITGGDVKMNKFVNGFQLVNSKAIKSTVTGERQSFPVQVAMDIHVSGKVQHVQFGFSAAGGRKTYLAVAGAAPVAMTRADFVKKLQVTGVENMKVVTAALNHIRSFHKDEFVVAKCECCATGYVTAANIDFVQRNYAALTEKLGREVTEFSRICYVCQGAPVKKSAPATQESVKIPATASKPACECCGKEVSANVVRISKAKYGKVLCYPTCQNSGKFSRIDKKAAAQPEVKAPVVEQAPVVAPVAQEEASVSAAGFSPALVKEILALDVDKFSEIAKLQDELRTVRAAHEQSELTLWGAMHQEHVAAMEVKAAVEEQPVVAEDRKEIVLGDDHCVICNCELPDAIEWEFDWCPQCVVDEATNPMLEASINKAGVQKALVFLGMNKVNAKDEADKVSAVASDVASVISSADSEDSAVAELLDTQEVPAASQAEVTVSKSPMSEASQNDSHADFMDMIANEYPSAGVLPQDKNN